MIYEASPEGCQIRYLGSLSARQESVLRVGSLRRAPRTRPKMWLFLYRTVPLAKATLPWLDRVCSCVQPPHSGGKRIYSGAHKLSCNRSHDCIVQNMRVTSVRAARRKLVKLFRKSNSKFYWNDFTVRGHRYRASTEETKSVRALRIASLKLASVIENTDPLPSRPTALGDFAERFLAWVDTARLEEMTRKFYRNGWRVLKAPPLFLGKG